MVIPDQCRIACGDPLQPNAGWSDVRCESSIASSLSVVFLGLPILVTECSRALLNHIRLASILSVPELAQ
jgi:hypothetical protein